MLVYESGLQIVFQEASWKAIIEHCRRKLRGEYLPGEAKEKKAYGLLAGVQIDKILDVRACFPLLKNYRSRPPYKEIMDQLMASHAVLSETSLDKRGWVADPAEWTAVMEECRRRQLMPFGAYHMHRVAWPHDRSRDTPTELDTILGAKSRQFMFIVSMVDPETPVIRAFFEGDLGKEAPVLRK
ncbi:MAG: hypothetical protein A2521_03750 [Deltaproteobacteria bacterium RIFOXYD12_FULL_57_12]|nr:MAG: hypothetical protein A2521_03750 [Deltaproteobacteria bacterium RIFOXYD12_FULL_57_12]